MLVRFVINVEGNYNIGMNKDKQKSESGISLVEVLIAGGLMAGLAVVLMSLNKESFKTQKSAEVNFNMNQVWISIQSAISVRNNCSLNFKGMPLNRTEADFALTNIVPDPQSAPPLLLFPDNALWRAVSGQMHQPIVRVLDAFNNEFRIVGISTERIGTTPEFNLRIRAEKLKDVYGSRETVRNFRIQAVVNDAGTPAVYTDDTIVSCFTDESSIIDAAIEEICKGGGGGVPPGVWNDTLKTCTFISLDKKCANGLYASGYQLLGDSLEPICSQPIRTGMGPQVGNYKYSNTIDTTPPDCKKFRLRQQTNTVPNWLTLECVP